MPISIPLRHIDRMFPYEFYAELYEEIDLYVPFLETFVLKTINGSVPNEKKLYEKEREELRPMFKDLSNNNIIHLTSDLQVLLNMPVIASVFAQDDLLPLEQAYMFVQYYDKEQQPLFTQEQNIGLIRQIPEILWDDPNLLIGIYDPNLDPEDQVLLFKTPDFVIKQLYDEDALYDN